MAQPGIVHQKVVAIPDEPTQSDRVQPSDWNDEHFLYVLKFGVMTTPMDPDDGDVWVEAEGTSPTRTIAVKVQDQGITRTLASITF